MKNFAVMHPTDPTIVFNIVYAADKETAEAATGKTCIEYTEENPAIIGMRYIDGAFEAAPVIEEHEIFPPLQPGDEGYIEPVAE